MTTEENAALWRGDRRPGAARLHAFPNPEVSGPEYDGRGGPSGPRRSSALDDDVRRQPGADSTHALRTGADARPGFDGNRFRGEILPELERLKREGVVRILDLLLVRKDSVGAITHLVASDLDWEEAAAFGETMGMLAGLASEGLRAPSRAEWRGWPR